MLIKVVKTGRTTEKDEAILTYPEKKDSDHARKVRQLIKRPDINVLLMAFSVRIERLSKSVEILNKRLAIFKSSHSN